MVILAPSETLLARPPQSGFSLRAKGTPTPRNRRQSTMLSLSVISPPHNRGLSPFPPSRFPLGLEHCHFQLWPVKFVVERRQLEMLGQIEG